MKIDFDELILLNLLNGSLHIVRDGGDGFNVACLATPATEEEIMQEICKKRRSLRKLINKTRLGYVQAVPEINANSGTKRKRKCSDVVVRVDESEVFYTTPPARGHRRNRNITTPE